MTDSTGLALTRLTLTNFRNYSGLRLDVSARLIALSGPNGAGITDLASVVNPPTGFAYSVASGINNHGQVAAIGMIPEPETYAMLLAGLGLLGFVARRRKTA